MEENITIEFVKEWIDKHNLTKGSFDRIMNDLIYNSGHNYIDNPYLRYWLIDNTYKFRDMLPVELNDNQQVVLNQLCQIFMKQSYKSKMQAVYIFINKCMSDEFLRLDRNESNQVLAAFAEWGGRKYE
ncbi:hypothetical protein ACE40W_05375 [Enterococcus avium]|uniref:hypothetical protein n=1 Tax=Enterococcus avium TaxID=33945 RepID=UPI0035C95132